MSHIVHLPLVAEDFRQHPAIETEPRHWLLDSVYGRQLLKTKLHLEQPGLKVSLMREQRELDPQLAVQIELLGLDEWPRPNTLTERYAAFRTQLGMTVDLLNGRPMRSWRPAQIAALMEETRRVPS